VAAEVNGTWEPAIEVPGTTADVAVAVNSVSCSSPGNCVAVGHTSSSQIQAFESADVSGTWHAAVRVPGTAALNTANMDDVYSVSCPPAGNCVAGGDYASRIQGGGYHLDAFVTSP
jgi:hypothetical protein